MSISSIDSWIVILHYVAFLILGIYLFVKGKKTVEEYFLAERNLGHFHTFGTTLSTLVGVSFVVATSILGFQYGFSILWGVPSVFLASVLFILFIPKLKRVVDKLKLYTLSDILYIRYGRKTAFLSSIIIFLTFVALASLSILTAGLFLSAIFNLPINLSIFLITIAVVTYTLLGGYRVVVYTDVVQFFLIVIGIILLFTFSFNSVWNGNIAAPLPETFFDPAGWGLVNIIGMFIAVSLIFISSQDLWQRVYSAKSISVARKSFFITGIFLSIGIACTILIGIFAKTIIPASDPQLIIPNLIMGLLPTVLVGLVLTGFLAAFSSTADSMLNVSSMVFVKDIVEKYIKRNLKEKALFKLSRLGVLLSGLIAFGIPFLNKTLVDLIFTVATWFIVLVPAIIAGFYWKRANSFAAFWSILVGFIFALITALVFKMPQEAVFAAIIPTTLIMIIFSFFGKKPNKEQLKHFFKV